MSEVFKHYTQPNWVICKSIVCSAIHFELSTLILIFLFSSPYFASLHLLITYHNIITHNPTLITTYYLLISESFVPCFPLHVNCEPLTWQTNDKTKAWQKYQRNSNTWTVYFITDFWSWQFFDLLYIFSHFIFNYL